MSVVERPKSPLGAAPVKPETPYFNSDAKPSAACAERYFNKDIPGLISLAIPVRNGGAYITETIKSILAQDYRKLELIITDNASTDDTAAICRGFADRDDRVRYVRNPEDLGAGPNHNLGFRLSRGEYFKWCAADDLISPNFISVCLQALESTPDSVLAASSVRCIDETGAPIPLVGRCMTPHDPKDAPAARFFKDLLDRVTCTNFEVFGLIRSSALRKTCLQQSYYGADQTLVSELALHGGFVEAPQAILHNREHPQRSMNIRDRNELLRWQDTRRKGKARPTNWYRFLHLLKIVGRQRDPVRAAQLSGLILMWLALKVRESLGSKLGSHGGHAINGAPV